MTEPAADEHSTPIERPAPDDSRPGARRADARRALLVADEGTNVEALRANLAAVGLEVESASAGESARRVEDSAPSIVLIAFGPREGEGRLVTLARRLRTAPATFALPVVFLFRADERTLRSAALRVGADDYFAVDAPREEIGARLESLFWRVEAGRRSAPAVAEQHDEIDNFIFLLDAVAADARLGMTGTLALIETRAGGNDSADGGRVLSDTASGQTLAAAHGFLKLNLRRVDAVAFYGPATLLVYLPGVDSAAARSALASLRGEFLATPPSGDLFAGLSSFPADASEAEQLVEQAEAALERGRAENLDERVFVYGVGDGRDTSPTHTRRLAASEATRRVVRASRTESSEHAGQSPLSSGDTGMPASRTEAQAGDGRGAASRVAASAMSAGERRAGVKLRRLMLVVSDAARMAQVNLLLRSEGFEVRAAFDGHHALNLLRIDRPDLLLVDYELQGMDGAEMLRRLAKQSGANQAPPALMLVPGGREDLRREAQEAGAHRTLELPYDPVELLDALRSSGETE
ncbi:MAG TPA: response regulator [Pyrinomonadaceae bacterium]|nr:response regulator [Pyrinomonadaceae bacterium]